MMPVTDLFSVLCVAGQPLFSLPSWYEYLNCVTDSKGQLAPQISGISDIWLIVAAIIDILLRLAALIAIGFVVYGGVQYLSSQGQPDRTTKARGTIINALIGLVISIAAATLVAFVAGRFN